MPIALSDLPSNRLLDLLSRQHPASSRSTIRRWIADGRVTVDDVVERKAGHAVAPGAVVRLTEQPAIQAATAMRWPVPVVYADDDLLVIDKPAGLLTSTVPREKRPTALALVRDHAAKYLPRARVGLVHRLDRDASGLLVFALSQRALASLKRQFADRSAGRVYHAVVGGVPRQRQGTIDASLAEHADGTVHWSKHPGYARPAVTHYEVLAEAAGRALLRVRLETGRKHQIRSHLAGIGHPIVGDAMYGGAVAPRLMLAAIELALEHPSGGRKVFHAAAPHSFAALFSA